MLDKLIEVLLTFLELFKFWHVVDEYERGLVLRLGKFNRELDPGLHWVIPMGVDKVLHDNVVPRTCTLEPQSLVTADGKTVAVSGVVTSAIRDIRKAMLEVEGVDHALVDSCSAAIAEHVSTSEWKDLISADFNARLTKACRAQAFRYGLEIKRVQLSDLSPCRAIRIHTASHAHLKPLMH